MSGSPEVNAVGIDPEELAELRSAIQALRSQLSRRAAQRTPPAEGPPPPSLSGSLREWLGTIDAMQLFDELRDRFSILGGVQEHQPAEDDFGLDLRALGQARGLLDFLYQRWWRVETTGAEGIPGGEPVLFVGNRSGILPYDGLMIAHAVERHVPGATRPRFLVADWLVTLPFSQPWLARLGGVRACPENAERLLSSGESVVAFPEGQKGALKLFRDRYRLQRFGRGGFVTLAARHRVAVVPVAVVGAEEAHPVLFRSELVERLLGLPLPITPTFPHLGPLGLIPLPSLWRIRFGDPIRFTDVPPDQLEDPLYVNRARERVRGAIQALVEEEVRKRPGLFR